MTVEVSCGQLCFTCLRYEAPRANKEDESDWVAPEEAGTWF